MKTQILEQQALTLNQNQPLQSSTQSYSYKHYQQPPQSLLSIRFLLCTTALLLILLFSLSNRSTTKLPKILWIYTHNEYEGEPMVNQIFINYYIDIANKMDYQVRIINSWTAYDWLSQQITSNITQTMQGVQIDVGVDDLLMLAVLIQNGGILFKHQDVILLDDFGWLQDIFGDDDRGSGNLACQASKSGILLATQQKATVDGQSFADSFIASLPHNKLLIETFSLYRTLMSGDQTQRDNYPHFFYWRQNTKIYSSDSLLRSCLNLIIEQKNMLLRQHEPPRQEDSLCNVINLQYFTSSNPFVDISSISEIDFLRFVTNRYRKNNRLHTPVVIKFPKSILSDYLGYILRGQKKIASLQDQSLLKRILSARGNKQIFIDELPQRNLSLCLIYLEEFKKHEVQTAYRQIKTQQFINWHAVFFLQRQQTIDQTYRMQHSLHDPRVIAITSRAQRGRNIEVAITQHCPHHSYALLLHKEQVLNSTSAFSQLIKLVKPREVVGAFIPLQLNKTNLYPSQALKRFNRIETAITNPKIQLLKNASNHFRLFSVEVYRLLPQFDLRDSYNLYYNDRIIFLMSMLDLIRDDITQIQEYFIIRKYSNQFNLPRKVAYITNISIITQTIDEIDTDQLKRTFTRIQVQSIHSNLQNIIRYRIPFDKLIVLNQGRQYTPFTQKISEPYIPAIIHQAWLGGALPPAKQYLFRKTAKLYPNYQMKLWTLDNITKENFPLTYQILKNIQKFNSISPYNKFATMTDILRHQLLYRQGGFWKDAAMHFLKPVLDDFRKYKLALATDKTIRHRWLQGMCFFGNMKEYPPLWRITNYRNLNRMRIYNSDPMDIAGPIDFRQLIIGKQEYDPEILVLSYETFYPAQLGQHPAGDLCTRRVQSQNKEIFEVVEKGWGILKNCSQIYPYTFGLEHNRYGGSWSDAIQKRKKH